MIQFAGEERFLLSPAELYLRLADAGQLARCLPDAEVLEALPDRAVWKQRPKLSFISGAIETTLTVANRVPEQAVHYTVFGKGVGASSTVETRLEIATFEAGSAVRWAAEITALSGLLKMAPRGLIQATAENVISEVWMAVRAQIDRPA